MIAIIGNDAWLWSNLDCRWHFGDAIIEHAELCRRMADHIHAADGNTVTYDGVIYDHVPGENTDDE